VGWYGSCTWYGSCIRASLGIDLARWCFGIDIAYMQVSCQGGESYEKVRILQGGKDWKRDGGGTGDGDK